MTQDPLRSFFETRSALRCPAAGKGNTRRRRTPRQRGPTYLDDDVVFVRVLDVLQDLLRQSEALLHKLLPLRLSNKCACLWQWRGTGGEHGHEAAQDDGCGRERSEAVKNY